MAMSIKICCLMLFLVNIKAMPTTTPMNPSSLESLIFRTLHWDTEIKICDSNFFEMMTFVCNFCKNKQCNLKDSHPAKTHNEILDLANQCCIDYCRFDTMQLFCGFESFLDEYMNGSTAIGNPIIENIYRENEPNIFQTILTYLPSIADFSKFL